VQRTRSGEIWRLRSSWHRRLVRGLRRGGGLIDDVCDFADFALQVGGFGFDIVGFCVLNFSRRSGKGCSILSLRSRWRLESLVPAADVDIIAENVKGNSS